MDQDRWREVNTIFHAALEVAPSERHRFVLTATRGDTDIQAEVEALLQGDEDAGSYFEHPPFSSQATVLDEDWLHAGDMLRGRFRIVREIAKGGMGQVFEAFDSELNVHVAVKVLRPEIASDPNAIARFRREVRLARSINHANVCRTFDIERDLVTNSRGDTRPITFLTMEFLKGETMSARIRKTGAISPDLAVELARELASAIDAAHSLGIIHRDLKPGNVMLVPTSPSDAHNGLRAIVTDFGLARFSSLSSEPDSSVISQFQGGLVGTIAYMSPEQLAGDSVTTATDIYSFGLILFEMITGCQVFPPESLPEGISQRLAGLAPRVQECLLKLPQQWAAAVEWCLRSKAAERPESASEVIAVIDGKREPTTSTEVKRQRNRRIALSWVWSIAVSAVLALIYFLRPTLPSPQVKGIRQLTNDGVYKFSDLPSPLGSDESRIYFLETAIVAYTGQPGVGRVMQVSIKGGEAEPVPSNIPFTQGLYGISRTRSELLLAGPPHQIGGPAGLWLLPLSGTQPRRIGQIITGWADWNSDGTAIYYDDMDGHLFIANVDGTGARKLLTANGWPAWTRLSPDGRLLRFTVAQPNSSPNSLWEARSDGSDIRQLLAGWSKSADVCCGSWTPDGSYYIFQLTREGRSSLWAVRETGDLWRKVGHDPVQLTQEQMSAVAPLISRDGKTIFFIGVKRRGELIRYDLKTHSSSLHLGGISAEMVTSTKDGQKIAYVSYPENILWESKPDGGDRHQVTFPPMRAVLPRWSSDSKRIAFSGQQPGGRWQIYVVPDHGGNPQQLTSINTDALDPSWSPDDSSLAFGEAAYEAFASNRPNIHILNLKTGQVNDVPDSKGLFSPRWSPDGRWLMAVVTGSNKLVVYDFALKKWEELGSSTQAGYPDWSRDGKCLYFLDAQGKALPVYRICLSDRKIQQVGELGDIGGLTGTFSGWASLASDNALLALHNVGTEEVYALDVKFP
jgi:eukaryotic-like serine/threonine-protein kinase